jgi:16S rRNA C967 or C1407 C5-methylase (RsmB/RsmF family)
MVEMPSNAVSESVDLTEASLLKSLEWIKEQFGDRCLTAKPMHIVPTWVYEEIVAQYGEATAENFHRWNCKRLGL